MSVAVAVNGSVPTGTSVSSSMTNCDDAARALPLSKRSGVVGLTGSSVAFGAKYDMVLGLRKRMRVREL